MASVKGFATWNPKAEFRRSLEQVQAVIEDARDDWPLTQRYWLYRLMGVYGWEKFDEYNAARYRKENGKKDPPRTPYNLNHILDRGRRAGVIPWEAVASSRGIHLEPNDFSSPEKLADVIEHVVTTAQFNRQSGQDRRVVLWMETEGLAPTMRSTAARFGAPVLAGKGFDVLGRKYDFAQVVADQSDVLVLHAGDLDKSGHTVKTSLDADLSAFIEGLGGKVEIERIALTEDQVHSYGLNHTATGTGLNAGNHGGGYDASIECQLEAMKISDIRSIVQSAFERHLDLDLVQAAIDKEPEQQAAALRYLLDQL